MLQKYFFGFGNYVTQNFRNYRQMDPRDNSVCGVFAHKEEVYDEGAEVSER